MGQDTAPVATPTEVVNVSPAKTPTKKRLKKRRLSAADSLARFQQQVSATNSNNNTQSDTTQSSVFNIGSSTNSATVPNPDVKVLDKSDNPFDILRGRSVTSADTTQTTSIVKSEPAPPSLLDKKTYSKNFIFWIFVVVLGVAALIIANVRGTIQQAYSALYSDSALRQIYKEPVVGWGSVPYILLYSLFWLNAGIFLYLLLNYYGVKLPYGQFVTFALCVGGVSLAFILKHLTLYIAASVFPIGKEMRTYNFVVVIAGILLGLLLMPLNLFIAFAPSDVSEIAVFTSIGAVLFIYLVRSLRGLTVASPYILSNRFHFLLYLCTVEIAPLLIIAKFVLTNM